MDQVIKAQSYNQSNIKIQNFTSEDTILQFKH